MKEAGTKVLAS